jgi:hypothetical protein
VEEDFEMEEMTFEIHQKRSFVVREMRDSNRDPRRNTRKSEEEDRLVLMCSRLSASTLPLSPWEDER